MKEKKHGIKAIKEWWDGLDYHKQKTICIFGMVVGGALVGSSVQAISDKRKIEAAAALGKYIGYNDGKIAAFKEVAMNNPFKDLKNPTVTKF